MDTKSLVIFLASLSIAVADVEFECTFDKDTCDFKDDRVDDIFDWRIGQGPTQTPYTGPSADHTLGNRNGRYAHIEASTPRKEGHFAHLYSKEFPFSSRPRCLNFYYHMYGLDMGRLNVYLHVDGAKMMIWTMAGDQGNMWLRANASLPCGRYNIMFEGVVGDGPRSDIAIDDIVVYDTACDLDAAATAGPCINDTAAFPTTTTLPPLPTGPGATIPPKSRLVNPGIANFQSNTLVFICQFDSNFCGMNQDKSDQLDWARRRGRASSTFSGPANGDHSGNNGYYIYSRSSGRKTGDVARLLLPTLNNTDDKCLEFYYYQYGIDMGKLNVGAYSLQTATHSTLWEVQGEVTTGSTYGGTAGGAPCVFPFTKNYFSTFSTCTSFLNFGNDEPWCGTDKTANKWGKCYRSGVKQWQRALVNIAGDVPTISIETVMTSNSFYSDYAIDDIKIGLGKCPDIPTPVRPTLEPAPPAPTPSSASDIEFDCTFDDDNCGFKDDKTNDDFDWRIGSGKTQTDRTGPSSDHTQGSWRGKYAHIEASYPRKPNEVARLYSPEFSFSPQQRCLNFFYHMYGKDIGRLNVYLHIDGATVQMWSLTGEQGNAWYRANATLPCGRYEIMFEGVMGNGYFADIAIDDITVVKGPCVAQRECRDVWCT
ncbi:MAM and LDL-receptor class A domain-containing protein 1-like [Lingula anatina]|uniref:MAM and LDL-receptor class A domain-containing protein 1-like n=1 Tax=Lingula anatina TaxID=7574 RepID=A0A1S3JUF7_LINAN|nr:MAM and LDL-receptor class A domain-containing protein 1-like [Lingula anatina]|eukprot:XP_013414005.1 MAM and LDL-receptor class A domain-containing protein 1-like [Lingula anatina]